MRSLLLYALLITTLSGDLAKANDFASFLSVNATLAVVVDHEYVALHGENVLGYFQKIMDDVIREHLHNGGINVKYFSWNNVRLKKDFIAAITITNCENSWKFYEATKVSSILLLAITDVNCPRMPLNQALMIPIVENGDELPQVVLDIKVQQLLKWQTAIVILDQSLVAENEDLLKAVVHENVRHGMNAISIILAQIDDSLNKQRKRNAIRQALQPFASEAQSKHQFLIVSKLYEDIIEEAEELQMFHIYNQWLFFVPENTKDYNFDMAAVTQQLNEGVNIAFALNDTSDNCEQTINCTIQELCMAFVTSISRIIAEEQSIYGEISDEEWEFIRLTKQEKQKEILNYVKEYLKINSQCMSCARWHIETAINWGKSMEHTKQTNLQNDNRNRNFEIVNIGYWNPVLGFITYEQIFPHIEHNFRNITLDIITVHNPPWQILVRDHRGVIISHKGIVMELVKELSRLLNFTYILHDAKSANVYDQKPELNNTNALIGSLTYVTPYEVIEAMQENKFFMAAVASTIDEPDQKSFEYTIPISIQKYSFITRQPDEVSRIYLFTAPFTLDTWACLLAAILLTAPMLYGINHLAPLSHMRIDGLKTLNNCFWYIYGALLQQGGMYLPKADSARLVVGVWWIVVIVLITTYCGNLVTFLTFPKYQPTADYVFQIFRSNGIKQYGLRNNTFFEKYTYSANQDIYNEYMAHVIIYNNAQEEDLTAVRAGSRVNIDWRINLQLVVQRQFEQDKECKYTLGKEQFVDERIGLMVPSNSPYLPAINQQIVRMFQMGFIERWHQINLPSSDKCNAKRVSRQIVNHEVNMADMQGCFLVLLFGFTFAVLIILFEYFYYRFFVLNKHNKALRRAFAN